jgi:predicted nucleotidyltransferase
MAKKCNPMCLSLSKIESIYIKPIRDVANSSSDVDILVDLDYTQKIGLQFIQMKLDLEKLLESEVDLVSSNGLSKYIKPIIDSEKLLIYEK